MYLDPGFGSMLIQLIIAALAGVSALWFAFRNKFFHKRRQNSDATGSDDTQTASEKTDEAQAAADAHAEAVTQPLNDKTDGVQ